MSGLMGLGGLVIIPIVVAMFLTVCWLVQLLWNHTMPEIFELNHITYWQAVRLFLLALLLFGGPATG